MFKSLQTIFTLLLTLLVLVVSILNMAKDAVLTFLGEQVLIMPLGAVILAGFGLGIMALMPIVAGIFGYSKSKVSLNQHQKEKAQVRSEASGDQIRALESKIKTLEMALDKALKS